MEINHTYDQHDLQVCLKPTTGHQQQPSLLISLAYTLQTASCHFACPPISQCTFQNIECSI